MGWKMKIFNLFADLGDWLMEKSKDKGNATILAVLCIFSPLNLIFAVSFIAAVYRKGKKK
jgi:hypothetical protein